MDVTLNITANSLRLLSVKGRRVEKWASAPLAPGLVKDGTILEPKEVGAALDTLFKSTKLPKEKVIASLTGLSFTHRILSLPRTKPALLAEAIQRSAKREIPLPLEELYLSWQAINGKQDELDFFVLGVPRNPVDSIVATLKEAGVKSYIIDLKPLALARAASRSEALIVDLESDCFDVILVAGGVPSVIHTIAPRGGEASLEDNIRRLSDELLKTVKFYNTTHPQATLSPDTTILLTGALATDENAARLIQQETGYPVELLVPPFELPPDLPVAPFVTNIGLALKTLTKKMPKGETNGFNDINIDILSERYRARARPISKRQVLLPLALVIAVGVLFILYQLKSQAEAENTRLEATLSALSQQLREARLALNEASQTLAMIAEINADTQALKQEQEYILGKRGRLANELTLVTTTLPTGSYFTSIKIDDRQITIEGETDSSAKVVSYAEALENQTGFAEVRIANITEAKTDKTSVASFSIVITR